MASMAGSVNTLSTQTSMAAPSREAGNSYCHPSGMDRSGARFCVTDGSSGSRDHSFESTPHPAYGSELSTGGGRLVRALTAMEPARHPFPVSSTAPYYRRIKSESQGFSKLGSGPISGNPSSNKLAQHQKLGPLITVA